MAEINFTGTDNEKYSVELAFNQENLPLADYERMQSFLDALRLNQQLEGASSSDNEKLIEARSALTHSFLDVLGAAFVQSYPNHFIAKHFEWGGLTGKGRLALCSLIGTTEDFTNIMQQFMELETDATETKRGRGRPPKK